MSYYSRTEVIIGGYQSNEEKNHIFKVTNFGYAKIRAQHKFIYHEKRDILRFRLFILFVKSNHNYTKLADKFIIYLYNFRISSST